MFFLFLQILIGMQEQRRISRLHNQVFFELKKRCPNVGLPPLYKEIFSEETEGVSSFPGTGSELANHHHHPLLTSPMENNFNYLGTHFNPNNHSSHFNLPPPPHSHNPLPNNEPQTSTSRVNGVQPRYPYHVSTSSDVTMRPSTTRSSSTSSIGSVGGGGPLQQQMGAPPSNDDVISPSMSDGVKSHSSTSSCHPEYPAPLSQSSHHGAPPPGRYTNGAGQMFADPLAMPPTYQMSMLAQSSQPQHPPPPNMRPPEVVPTISHAPL